MAAGESNKLYFKLCGRPIKHMDRSFFFFCLFLKIKNMQFSHNAHKRNRETFRMCIRITLNEREKLFYVTGRIKKSKYQMQMANHMELK